MPKNGLVTEYARMWPRLIFDIIESNKLAVKQVPLLTKAGVYVLYTDDRPYYIGRATISLFKRLHAHANISTDRYFNLWNYFSAFVVNPQHISAVEGILIAAMPTANSANPRIKQVPIPQEIRRRLREARQGRFQ